jgi:hypothetical protein
MKKWRILCLAVLCLVLPAAAGAQSGRSEYTILSHSVDGGGTTDGGAGGYALGGTAGQPDAGLLEGSGFSLRGGFWTGGYGAPTVDRHWVYLPIVLRGGP